MKERVKLFFSYGLFWLIFFVFARILFLTYHFDKTAALSLGDMLLTLLHGLRLDLSMTGYFLVLPGLFIVLTTYLQSGFLKVFFNVYTLLLVLLCAFVVIVDLEMYNRWGFRLDATPLLYVGEDTPIPMSNWAIAALLFLGAIIVVAFMFLYKKLIFDQLRTLAKSDWKSAIVLLLITAAMIGPIRGTIGIAPINTGMVYFHASSLFANHTAINVIWNTGYALRKMNRLKYPGNFLDKDKTASYFTELNRSTGETQQIIATGTPNIIIIVMESYTYRFIEPLGGIPGVAPNFNKLVKEGVLFENMYASGDRTDKGIVSILSGYPSQPVSSVIKYPKKTQNLPYLNKEFKKMGYHTAFTYGGNIDFSNFRSYLSNAQFDAITHSDHFPEELNTSKWGVHDEYVFSKFLDETNAATAPFFKVMLTLSSHEPFDVPMETVFEGDDNRSRFLNSAHYTDRALGEFIKAAKKTDWWENTLIVITADHGHSLPDNVTVSDPNRFKIPMLWLGGALIKRDTVVSDFTNHTDIANTVLGQFSTESPEFLFSRNVFKEHAQNYAIYVYNNGFGFIDPKHVIIYDNTGQRYMMKTGVENDKDLDLGKAYMQTLYDDYNNR